MADDSIDWSIRVGDAVKTLRSDVPRKEFAEELGISYGQLFYIERGRAQYLSPSLKKIGMSYFKVARFVLT